MDPQEKELIVLEAILFLIPEKIEKYPEFKEGAVLDEEDFEGKILGVTDEELKKILWRLNKLGVIERGLKNSDPFVCYSEKINKYKNGLTKSPTNDGKIQLVLYADNYVCIKGFLKDGLSCHFRNRNGKHKRLLMLKAFAQNDTHRFTAKELVAVAGYMDEITARGELKRMFNRLAQDLNFNPSDLYGSDNNGYLLNCSLEYVDSPAP